MRWSTSADGEWRRWFAWHPVCLEPGRWLWLEWVEMRWWPPGQPVRYQRCEYRTADGEEWPRKAVRPTKPPPPPPAPPERVLE